MKGVLVILASISFSTCYGISCLGLNDVPVAWYLILTEPGKLNYLYFDSEMDYAGGGPQKDFIFMEDLNDQKKSPFAITLNQYYETSKQQDYSLVFYNDQVGDVDDCSRFKTKKKDIPNNGEEIVCDGVGCGHLKGGIIRDFKEKNFIHLDISIPGFPNKTDLFELPYKFTTESSRNQHIFCGTFHEDHLDSLAYTLTIAQANILQCINVKETDLFLHQLVIGTVPMNNDMHKDKWETISMKPHMANLKIDYFARKGGNEKKRNRIEFIEMASAIKNHYKEEIITFTYMASGKPLEPDCEPLQVFDVSKIKYPKPTGQDETSFSSALHHGKIYINSWKNQNSNTVRRVCISSLNRRLPQNGRSGMAFCFESSYMHDYLKRAIVEVRVPVCRGTPKEQTF